MGVVIDSVRGFDPRSGRTDWDFCEGIAGYIDDLGLEIPYVLDTHAHADHMSGIPFFKQRYRARSVIGFEIVRVQRAFRDLYALGREYAVDGSPFDILLGDGKFIEAGPLRIEGIHTPGHTPACMTYRIGEAIFAGDVLFMPDSGTGRCDFPGGSAEALYDSVQRLYSLPDETRVFTGHDYQPGGRELRFESTIGDQKSQNCRLPAGLGRGEFVESRKRRDAELEMPNLLLASLQVNIRAGLLPDADANGIAYLRIPLNAL